MERIETLFVDARYPRLLLKGSAYFAQGLPIAVGRLPSDLDMLVPKVHVAAAQARLIEAGWQEAQLDDHDRQYYRDWSHELPPMTHASVPMELDLHHNILPPVGHVRIDADLLLAECVPSGRPGWHVLGPVDQVLHSAAHLFFDADLHDRVRDLVDLDGLLRHFAAQHGGDRFWAALAARAVQLKLQEPLALALHFCQRWLCTPVPAQAAAQVERVGPGPSQRAWLLPVLATVLSPADPEARPGLAVAAAARLLQGRYHWRRMPLNLLLPHLWHKWRKPAATGDHAGTGAA